MQQMPNWVGGFQYFGNPHGAAGKAWCTCLGAEEGLGRREHSLSQFGGEEHAGDLVPHGRVQEKLQQ